MRSVAVLRNSFLLGAAACFATAYAMRGFPGMLVALPLAFAFWVLLRRRSVLWRSACLLAAFVGLAAAGVMLHVSVALMALSIAGWLAAWDLVNFQETLKLSMDPAIRRTLGAAHLRSLWMALGAGVSLASAALLLRLELPFAATGVLALVLLAALTGAARRFPGLQR